MSLPLLLRLDGLPEECTLPTGRTDKGAILPSRQLPRACLSSLLEKRPIDRYIAREKLHELERKLRRIFTEKGPLRQSSTPVLDVPLPVDEAVDRAEILNFSFRPH